MLSSLSLSLSDALSVALRLSLARSLHLSGEYSFAQILVRRLAFDMSSDSRPQAIEFNVYVFVTDDDGGSGGSYTHLRC